MSAMCHWEVKPWTYFRAPQVHHSTMTFSDLRPASRPASPPRSFPSCTGILPCSSYAALQHNSVCITGRQPFPSLHPALPTFHSALPSLHSILPTPHPALPTLHSALPLLIQPLPSILPEWQRATQTLLSCIFPSLHLHFHFLSNHKSCYLLSL